MIVVSRRAETRGKDHRRAGRLWRVGGQHVTRCSEVTEWSWDSAPSGLPVSAAGRWLALLVATDPRGPPSAGQMETTSSCFSLTSLGVCGKPGDAHLLRRFQLFLEASWASCVTQATISHGQRCMRIPKIGDSILAVHRAIRPQDGPQRQAPYDQGWIRNE